MFVSFLINYSENGVCEVYYLQNLSENEEDLLSCPKVVIKKETFNSNHGSFPQDFHKEFNEHEVFHRVQRNSVGTHELLFLKLNSNLVKFKSLSLHEVNEPSTESL